MGKKQKEWRRMAPPNQSVKENVSNSLLANAKEFKPSNVILDVKKEEAFWNKNAYRFTREEFDNLPPLAKAVFLGCEREVDDLLNGGENMHIRIPKDGSNLVMISTIMHHNHILKKLIEIGVDWKIERNDGTTPLMASVYYFNYPAFIILSEMTIKDDKTQLDVKSKQDNALLHQAVKGPGDSEEHHEMVRRLTQLYRQLELIEDDHRTESLPNPTSSTPDKAAVLEQVLFPLLNCLIRDFLEEPMLKHQALPYLLRTAEKLVNLDPELLCADLRSAVQPEGELYRALLMAAGDAGLQDKMQERDPPSRMNCSKKVKGITFHASFESKSNDPKKNCNATQEDCNPHTGYADALKKNLSPEPELIENQADIQTVSEKTLAHKSSCKELKHKNSLEKSSSDLQEIERKSSTGEKIWSIFKRCFPSVYRKLQRFSPPNKKPETPESSFLTATSNADSSTISASNEESFESSGNTSRSSHPINLPAQIDEKPIGQEQPKTNPSTKAKSKERINRRLIVCKILQGNSEAKAPDPPKASKRLEGRSYSDVARSSIEHSSDQNLPLSLEKCGANENQPDMLKPESFPGLPNKSDPNYLKSDGFPELPKTERRKTQSKGKRTELQSSESSLGFSDNSTLNSSSFSSINDKELKEKSYPSSEDSKALNLDDAKSSDGPCETPKFPAFERVKLPPISQLKTKKTPKYDKFYRRIATRKMCSRKLFSTPKIHKVLHSPVAINSKSPEKKISEFLRNKNTKRKELNWGNSTLKLNIDNVKTTKAPTNRSWVFKRAPHRRPSVREMVMLRRRAAPRSAEPREAAGIRTAAGACGSRWLGLLRGLEHCLPLSHQQLNQQLVETGGARVTAARCALAGKVLFGHRLSDQLEGGNFVGLLEHGLVPVVVRVAKALHFPFEDVPRWRSISHVNLSKFIDYSIDGGRAFLVRELSEFSLPEFLKSDKAASFVKRMMVKDLVEALRYLHERKIVHGFIKPNNVLVNMDYRLKLADFFLLRVVTPVWGIRTADSQTTAVGSSFENLTWRPSELIAAKSESEAIKNITAASDIQMAGMVLYYIWSSGHHPYGGSSELECQQKVAEGTHSLGPYPTDVEARDLVSQALEFRPGDRPTAQVVARHPFFWESEKQFQFLLKVGQKIEFFTSKPTRTADEFRESCIEARDWISYIQPDLMKYISSCTSKKYTNDIPDLLHFALVLQENFEYMPFDQRSFVIDPSRYILTTFPSLLMSIYPVIRKNKSLQKQMALQIYF